MQNAQNDPKDFKMLLNDVATHKVSTRIMEKDASLWSKEENIQVDIKKRLGWVDSKPFLDNAKTQIFDFYEKVTASNFKYFVWVGMGGSSLFAKALTQIFNSSNFYILDSTDVTQIENCLSELDIENTLFFIASKSGGTLETRSVFTYLQSLGIPDNHFVGISDADTSLSKLFAQNDRNFYEQFINPSDIGGRFSSISYFGLIPFALIAQSALDENIANLLKDYQDDALNIKIEAFCAYVFKSYSNTKANKLVLHFPKHLSYFAHWVEQLIAESTGKKNSGFIPFPSEFIKQDRKDYIHIVNASSSKEDHNLNNTACFPIDMKESNLLLQSYVWMKVTAILGYYLKFNPFDEPNVSSAKALAQSYLEKSDLSANTSTDDISSIDHHLKSIANTDQNFIALLFFGHCEEEVMKNLSEQLSKRYQLPCLPYPGPQYLHSVGQYFKGGHSDASFIVVYNSSDCSSNEQKKLEKIKLAQSLGDYDALKQEHKTAFFVEEQALLKFYQA